MGTASEMIATREEMREAKLDIGYRDFCAHLLIPLNECRRKSFFLPWKCEHERHVYEKCQYKECVRSIARFGRTRATRVREGDAGARTAANDRVFRSIAGSSPRRAAREVSRGGGRKTDVDVRPLRARRRDRRYMKRVAAMKASKE